MVNVPGASYRVSILWIALRQLREAIGRARSAEVERQFRNEVQALLLELAADPITHGDRLQQYRHARLDMYQRINKDMIYTKYAVDETNRIVYVQQCRPVLSHPLAPP
jgi:hypothetical protein